MRKGDAILSTIILIVCAVGFYETTNFSTLSSAGDVGMQFWPRVLIILLVLFVLINTFMMYMKKADSKNAGEKNEDEVTANFFQSGSMKVFLSIISLIAFYFIYEPLGFFISILLLYMVLAIIVTEKVDYKKIGIITIQSFVVATIVFAIFDLLLNVNLPYGVFF